MNEALITIMLLFATAAVVSAGTAITVFLFLLTREMIKDNLHE